VADLVVARKDIDLPSSRNYSAEITETFQIGQLLLQLRTEGRDDDDVMY
jgi:hypothetical protein